MAEVLPALHTKGSNGKLMDYQLLLDNFANTDLEIIDQVLKGKIPPRSKILDAGCGEGRNLTYFVKNNYPLWAIDCEPMAVQYCKYYCKGLNSAFKVENILQERIEEMLFPPCFFDVVFCINVIHAAESTHHIEQMMSRLHHVLKEGGFLLLKYKTTTRLPDISKLFAEAEPEKIIRVEAEEYTFRILQSR